MKFNVGAVSYVGLQFLLINFNLKVTTGLFKMTNLHCESFNASWTVINNCRLRAIKRGITVLNLNISVLHPEDVVHANFAIVKKANGYKPFLVNVTVDICEFLKKPNNPVVRIIFNLFQDFSNINHTCPYVGDQILNGFYLRENLLTLPFPSGEYGLLITWYLRKLKAFHTNVYFEMDLKISA